MNYNTNHPDYHNANMAMVKMQTLVRLMPEKLQQSVSTTASLSKLTDVPRESIGERNGAAAFVWA